MWGVLLNESGFIAVSDYEAPHESGDVEQRDDLGQHQAYQNFAGSRAIGLNFRLLKAYFA